MNMPLFYYNEEVTIINGFYRGATSHIQGYRKWFWFETKYKVYVVGRNIWIKESALRSKTNPHKYFNKKLNKIIE